MSAKSLSIIMTLVSNLVLMLVLVMALKILPNSPFQTVMEKYNVFGSLSNYMQYILYFLPVGKIIVTLELWVVCIVNYWGFEFTLKVFGATGSSGSMPTLTGTLK